MKCWVCKQFIAGVGYSVQHRKKLWYCCEPCFIKTFGHPGLEEPVKPIEEIQKALTKMMIAIRRRQPPEIREQMKFKDPEEERKFREQYPMAEGEG